ncbi:MAG: hypothetical protein QOD30_2292, partial [Actinomycetota bacterium]|nr:hypothetical protein [Actinomycetota bacterium]
MRARQPDLAASIDRDGFEIAYDVYNEHGTPTVVLLPTWQVASIEHWKAQVPVLARHHRVVTVHGRGTGRSSRPVDPAAYADRELVADVVAVLDELGVDHAVIVGTSWGGSLAAQLAAAHPDRVLGLVMIAAGGAASSRPLPYQPDLDESSYDPHGLELYALDAWRHHYDRFAQQFWELVFVEPHSTKQIEDGVGWALDTGSAVLAATTQRESVTYEPDGMTTVLGRVTAPTLLIQGTLDLITPMTPAVAAAESIGADVLLIEGGG